jgi:acetyltransferase
MALVAERQGGIVGVARLTRILGSNDAEVAVLVSDQFHGRGLGKELLARLVIVGGDEKLGVLKADILPDNRDVMRVCEKLGFTLRHSVEDEVVKAEFRY